VRETRPRRRPGADDWLGDVSDDDWEENAAARSGSRGASPAYEDADGAWPEPTADAPALDRPPVADARRAAVERRRIVAGGVVVALLGVAAAVLVVLLRDGGAEPVTSATTPTVTVTSPAPTESTPSTTTTTPPSTTPDTPTEQGGTTFTLPEGTTLRRGEENDAAVVTELQQALTTAGFDPGPADGVYGQGTEAAVVAFQEANDLAADGVVGPDTAAALNNALATG
jgi:hypothetical protein